MREEKAEAKLYKKSDWGYLVAFVEVYFFHNLVFIGTSIRFYVLRAVNLAHKVFTQIFSVRNIS